MTSKKPTAKKVQSSNKKWIAVNRLNIDEKIFMPGDLVTVKVPDWMIEQEKVKEDK